MNGDTFTAVIGAVGGLLTILFGFLWKIWADHNKLTREMIGIVGKNAEANIKLSFSISTLSSNVQENTKVTNETKDKLSQVLLEVVRNK